MDAQDIAQEIRIKCLESLASNQYEPGKTGGTPYSFLYRCIHNHLYNIRRGVWTVNNPPCVRCEYWSRKQRSCISVGGEDICNKMQKYRSIMSVKASLRTPVGFDKHCTDGRSVEFSSIEEYELHDLIINRLPLHLHSEYDKVRSGMKVPQDTIKILQDAIYEILKDGG
jgi:hypothetical protein